MKMDVVVEILIGVRGGRIDAARVLWRENVAGNGGGIDREVCLNSLQSWTFQIFFSRSFKKLLQSSYVFYDRIKCDLKFWCIWYS